MFRPGTNTATLSFANRFVEERLRPGAEPKRDTLQSWIKNGVPRDQLIQEICLQILAGSDTTATSIRMTVLFLLTSPPVLRKFLAEMDEGIASGKISSPITNSEAQALPYLQAIIHESLRMYPPGINLGYKQVPPAGDTLHGYYLPPGTQVGQNLWGMQRSKEVFGEDADVFRPERWLEADKAQYTVMKDTVGIVFGYGKYGCLGKVMAMMELNKIYVEVSSCTCLGRNKRSLTQHQLFRRFEFAITNPVKPLSLRNATLWLTSNFWLKVTRRE